MSKHGPRYTTAFNDEESEEIRKTIKRLAGNHNRVIHNELAIGIDDWRNAVLPSEVRELAQEAEKYYKNTFYTASVYTGTFALGGHAFAADWEGHPKRFPRPPGSGTSFHTDVAGAFVQRLHDLLDEWHANAVRYGMLLDVFDWLNDGFCAKGDRRHLRTVLPNVLPLIASFDRPFAATLSRPLTGGSRPAVPIENAAGIVRANQIIAGALLVPVVPLVEDHVSLSLQRVESSTHPEWPRRFKTIPALS